MEDNRLAHADPFGAAVNEVNARTGGGEPHDNGTAPAGDSSVAIAPAAKRSHGGARPGAGRKKGASSSSSSSSSSSAPSSSSSSSSARVAGPPAPPYVPTPEDIEAARRLIARLDGIISRGTGFAPLTADELQDGGEALAPLAPKLVSKITPEAAFAIWAVTAYGPRAYDAWQKHRSAKRAAGAVSVATATGTATAADDATAFRNGANPDALRRGVVVAAGDRASA